MIFLKMQLTEILVQSSVCFKKYKAGDFSKLIENPFTISTGYMDGGAWLVTVYGVTEAWIRLSDFTFSSFNTHSQTSQSSHFIGQAWKHSMNTIVSFTYS